MFFFGVLSNTLPYLFLFVLYVVGLGSWLLGKPEVKDNSGEASVAKTISVAEEVATAPEDCYHFSNVVTGTHCEQADIQSSENKIDVSHVVQNIPYIPTLFPEHHLTFRLFSRPPPVLS